MTQTTQTSSDKIFVNNLRVQAILGIYPLEREQSQEVVITLEIDTDCSKAAASKDLADSLDYATLAHAVAELTINGKYLLIETLIEDIAQHCLRQPLVQGVSVQVEKPQAVSRADSVGIKIYRYN
jgi:dihydroneopterin aldolase|tara:strand:- start:10332 stop:10706 length:375 start_codon:yes stop_codon:yes gene_type:complete